MDRARYLVLWLCRGSVVESEVGLVVVRVVSLTGVVGGGTVGIVVGNVGGVGAADVVVNCRVFCFWRCSRRRLAGLIVP